MQKWRKNVAEGLRRPLASAAQKLLQRHPRQIPSQLRQLPSPLIAILGSLIYAATQATGADSSLLPLLLAEGNPALLPLIAGGAPGAAGAEVLGLLAILLSIL